MVPRRTEPEPPKLRVRICRRRMAPRALLLVASRPLPCRHRTQSVVARGALAGNSVTELAGWPGRRGPGRYLGEICDVAILSEPNKTVYSESCIVYNRVYAYLYATILIACAAGNTLWPYLWGHKQHAGLQCELWP